MDPAEARQLRRLRERIALLSADRPFQNLEVIATLGMGGFGRVELVSFNYTPKFLPRLESHAKPLHPARAGQKRNVVKAISTFLALPTLPASNIPPASPCLSSDTPLLPR